MKFIKIIIFLFSFFIFSFFINNYNIAAYDISSEEIKDSIVKLNNNNYANNRAIVIMKDDYNVLLKNYTKNDFKSINCENVTELTSKSKNNNLYTIKLMNSKKNRILCLDLGIQSNDYVLDVINILNKRSDVLYATPDYKIEIASTLSNDSDLTLQWAIESISLTNAWDYCTGSNNILIGIMDTGIDGSHLELSNSIVNSLCRDFTSGETVVDNDLSDVNGHGTKVAGVIGAIGNNNYGITGVNWNVSLVSLKVFDDSGCGYSSNVAKAINYAESVGIKLLNLSGRWYSYYEYYNYVLNYIINDYSGLIVCAAGNDGLNNDIYNAVPSSLSNENIISVGSHDKNNNISIWSSTTSSNYGSNTVDIFAPGGSGSQLNTDNCYTTKSNSNSGFTFFNGTSCSTPFVTGVAALLLSYNPNLTASQLKTIIINSAEIPDVDGLNPFEGLCVSNGKLNAYNAIKYAILNYTNESNILDLNCMKNLELLTYCESYNSIIYKLNVECPKNYKIFSSSNNPIEIYSYDENLNYINTINPTMSSDCKTGIINQFLSSGEYYIKLNFEENYSGNILTTIEPSYNDYEHRIYFSNILNKNNVLTHLHEIEEDDYLNKVCYFNSKDNGFYKLVLNATLDDENIYIYPPNSIKVYDDISRTNVIEKFNISEYDNKAITAQNQNELICYLEKNKMYYIDICLDSNFFSSLYFDIIPLEEYNIDLFSLNENINTELSITSNDPSIDFMKLINIKQEIKIDILSLINNTTLSNSIFILGSISESNDYNILSLASINQLNYAYTEALTLDKGFYFIGYFNNKNMFDIKLTRVVTKSGSNYLITDPDNLSLYGSEVRFNNGAYNGNNITVGFTRYIYLNNGLDVPSTSRLDYNFYSSNEDLACVSIYGTILAKSIGTIRIMAVYKSNPSIVFVKEFIISNNLTTNIIINISENIRYSESGQLYTIELTDINSPYPLNSLYNWNVIDSNENILITEWGSFHLYGEDLIIIEGTSKLNSHIIIRINLNVS